MQTEITYFSFTQKYEIGYQLCTARQTSLEIKNNFFSPACCTKEMEQRTLWCQIRTARSLLGPVVEYPPCWFLWTMFFSFCTLWFLFRPCFSLQSPCGFYSDRVFSKCYIKSATVINTLRLVIPLWFLSGPRFSGSVLWGFYKEWGFCFLPSVVFIQAVVLQKLPMMFLFCPCAQSGTIE